MPTARRIDCPLPEYPEGWIELPAVWLGEHANKRDEVTAAAPDGTKQTALNWMVATALMENWGGIAPMEGNPDQWDFEKISLELIAWITVTVNGDYSKCWEIKKKPSLQ
jgi:hypothetical protein